MKGGTLCTKFATTKEQLLEIFGKKYFFPKKVFGKKVAQCRKPKKRSFRLIQRFLQTENFKKMQEGTL